MRIFLAAMTTLLIALFTHLPAQAAESESFCKITSEGIFAGYWFKHRIVIQDEVVFGANDMDSVLSQLEILRSEGLCR